MTTTMRMTTESPSRVGGDVEAAEEEAPAAATILKRLNDDTGVRRALVATLELSVECSMQTYHALGVSEPLDKWLASHLGENLLDVRGDDSTTADDDTAVVKYANTYSTYTYSNNHVGVPSTSTRAGGSGGVGSGGNQNKNQNGTDTWWGRLTPRGMLRKMLRGVPPGTQFNLDATAAALAEELRRRIASRRPALRERCVCVTWRGKHTNISTMSRSTVLDITSALTIADADFDVVLNVIAPTT